MTFSQMPKGELEESQKNLKRLIEAANDDYRGKYLQYQTLGQELNGLGESIKSFRASLLVVEKALGVPSEQIPLPEGDVKRGDPPDATQTVMRLVATHHETGGIGFDQIWSLLKAQGHKTSREYLHTILNRKKNYQKKLKKENGKWFLTEKGKEELGMQ